MGGAFGGGGGALPAPTIALTSVVVNDIKHLPVVDDAIPDYSGQLTLEGKGKTITIRVLAVDPQAIFRLVPNAEFDAGSAISSNDPSSMIVAENIVRPPAESFPFAVLGQALQAHYSCVDSNGNQVVNTRSFVLRAILKVTGSNLLDNAVIVPSDVATSLMNKGNRYDGMIVLAKSPDLVTEAQAEITHLYGNNIGITSSRAILNMIIQFRSGTNNFILSVALIASLVGAIGIVTTLYTSVMERTREIGTMKAIGAQNRHILSIFE